MFGKKNKQSSKLGTKKSEPQQMGMKSNDLQKILAKSYEKNPSDYGDYKVDKSLSGQRAQVYTNDVTGKVIVAHRGTAGMHDMITDAKFGFGNTNNDRFDHAKKIQREAEAKYGKDNIITVGHSLGGLITNKVSDGKQITYNKPTMFNSTNKNELAIKTSNDPFSLNNNRENSRKIVIDNGFNLNPFSNHSTDNIGKLNNEFL
jgi:putative lipase involved disintegration of autophagic bodies